MEDLWGSPWASDLPAHHATRLDDFPAAPQTVHFGASAPPQQQQQHALPRKISQNLSPWHDDDAWGDVQRPQRWRGSSNAGSPGLKAADGSAGLAGVAGRLRREVSPDPWKALDSGHFEARARTTGTGPGTGTQETASESVPASRGSEVRHLEQGSAEEKARETIEDAIPKAEPMAVDMQDHAWAAERDALRASAEPDLTKSSSEGEESSIEESGRDEPRELSAEPHVDIKDELMDSDHAEDADPGPKAFEVESETAAVVEEDAFPAPRPSMLFPIDFAALDRVFPTTGPVNTRPEPIPDVIIDNTFTTTSERKMWYRISRYGSSRKHDSGMDDSYVRANWAGSEVRSRTLKTVQRWMEQEALTGRVHLGGRPGASGASLFNWDTKAPPVEIGQLLEKHGRQTKHARHTSLVPAPTAPRDELGGWADGSSSSPAATEKPKQRPVSMIQLASAPMPNPWADSPTALKFAPMASPLLKTSPARPSNLKNVEIADNEPIQQQDRSQGGPQINDNNHDEDDEEDDDEWGEMVGTTPAGDTGGIFGPLSETARASLESFKGDVFDGESPPERAQAPNITDLPTSASTIWDVSHPEDGESPSSSAGGRSAAAAAAAAATAPTAFPFPPAYITPPITPAPGTPPPPPTTTTTRPSLALQEGISIDNANRKASLAQAIAMSSPATSVSDRDADLERAREKHKDKHKQGDEKEDDMDAVVAEILRNLPDLTYMLR